MEAIDRLLGRIPILLVAVVYIGWSCWGFYDWFKSDASTLGAKKAELVQVKQGLVTSEKRLTAAKEFVANLNTLRDRVRSLTIQLDGLKTTLSTDVDVPNFMGMVGLEAQKLAIKIKSIKPEAEVHREHYTEVPFTVQLKGAYVQLLVFFDRITRLQQVIRISDFDFKPSGNTTTKYVELDGRVKLLAYKYRGNKADEILNQEEMKNHPAQAGGGK